ncbi:PASTA domain-containing protein [Streptomyces sp. NPDC001100]
MTKQNPDAGTVLLPGSSVSITLGKKPAPPAQCP